MEMERCFDWGVEAFLRVTYGVSELPTSQLSTRVHVRHSVSRVVESHPENVRSAVGRFNVGGGSHGFAHLEVKCNGLVGEDVS